MTRKEISELYEAYGSRFGNLREIDNPELVLDPKFLELLKRALETGKPVTREELEREFPDIGWEELG
jgi:hypothetical protein